VRSSFCLLTAAVLVISSSLDRTSFVNAAPPGQRQEALPLFSVSSELVVLNVTVRDKGNRYLDGLDKESFTVFENDQTQPVRFFLHEDAPVTIGLLIDNSGSMQPNRDLVVAAATAFAKTSNQRDDMFALAFNEEVHPALAGDAPFTHDPVVLREALQNVVTTRGRTALYDAVDRGLQYVERGAHDRQVLVVVSDGDDNASGVQFEEVLKKIKSSNVTVYAVAIVDPIESAQPWKRLRDLADASGGELFHPKNVKQVNDVLQRVAQEIRHTYVMAYEPTQVAPPTGLRRIRVEVQTPSKQKITVRTRAGWASAARREARAGDAAHGR
jgi:Ca-activated chloride channel family protein